MPSCSLIVELVFHFYRFTFPPPIAQFFLSVNSARTMIGENSHHRHVAAGAANLLNVSEQPNERAFPKRTRRICYQTKPLCDYCSTVIVTFPFWVELSIFG